MLYRDWFPIGTGNLKPGAAERGRAELPALAFMAGPTIPVALLPMEHPLLGELEPRRARLGF